MLFRNAALLVVLLESLSSASATSVSYSDGGASAQNERKMMVIPGTEPPVDIYYDGTTAVCPEEDGGTGRRFNANESIDADCVTPDAGYDLLFNLDVGTILITSCPVDKVLKIVGADIQGNMAPSEGDKNFLLNTQKDLLDQPQVEQKLSVVAMSAKAMELLHDWPAWLGFDYDFNGPDGWTKSQANEAYQRDVTIVDENEVETVREKPAEKLVYSDCYNSLCFAADNYVEDANGNVAAKINMDPPCAGDSNMLFGATIPPTACTDIPLDYPTAPPATGYACGNCMGRCGQGCGAYPNSLRQFTNDCLDYDFCMRFNIDRDFAPADGSKSCANEFLWTIDDVMWSGNCDLETKKEIELDPCGEQEPPPTPAPVEQNVPPQLTVKPVLVTAVQAGSCNTACGQASGDWECSAESLAEQSFRFEYPNIRDEARKLNFDCDQFPLTDGLGSTTARIEAVGNPPTFTCWASEDDRADITPIADANFDCDAAVAPNELRLCTCYEA